jgi:hypothetical protein
MFVFSMEIAISMKIDFMHNDVTRFDAREERWS